MIATNAVSALESAFHRRNYDPSLAVWLVTGVAVVALFALRGQYDWVTKLPEELVIPLDAWLNAFMDLFVVNFKWLFRAMSGLLEWPMNGLQALLHWLPWPATIAGSVVVAHLAGGWRLAVFTLCTLMYMVIVGYWDESMNTLALVGMAVPLSVAVGLFAGILDFSYRPAKSVIQPTLDLMQTVPAFAYLIPVLLLFGFGPVVGLVAATLYACPPMVRNVSLGLQRVPVDIVESAKMSGCTDRQLLWWVRLPAAMPTIMIGVNQTIMCALSMVIIAAIIGGFGDIGWEVLSTMRRAQFGQSLLAGLVIVLIAMNFDRISRGLTSRQRVSQARTGTLWQRHAHLWVALVAIMVAVALAQVLPELHDYPKAWIFYPAAVVNDAVTWFTANYFFATSAIKSWTLFYFLLPIRIGLENSVTPHFWGFALNLWISLGYAAAVAGLALWVDRATSWRGAVAVLITGGLFYFGTTGTPWAVFILVVTVTAFRVGGWRVGVFALGGLCFMLFTGIWERAMLSVYLCGTAVLIAFLAGGLLGIWAARNDRVSAFLRPINDTLQTIPLYVFLIPIIMVFLVGEFSALLAVIAYAIVPAIRYTEHGIRHVPAETVEAARAMGCTPRQLLWQVQLPLALPEIMLGLNQTIMLGLAMLVIAALVGTLGLGQMIYIALTAADFGKGAVAGLGIA
ncbi:MAG: ABC transporter permease subunit, partial [Proteobacteria bacterium]|nr:ABC transporter permease subunit [Pseudomonadota bacterium]